MEYCCKYNISICVRYATCTMAMVWCDQTNSTIDYSRRGHLQTTLLPVFGRSLLYQRNRPRVLSLDGGVLLPSQLQILLKYKKHA